MKNGVDFYKDYTWDKRRELRERIVIYHTEKVWELLKNEGFVKKNWRFTNGTISINYWPEPGVANNGYHQYFDSVSNIKFENPTTNYTLGYMGYNCFGSYIMSKYLREYSNKDIFDKPNGYLPNEKIDEWEELFLKELKECIKETTLRINKKNKVQNVKTKVQNIENEIDYVITGYAEEHPECGLTFKSQKNPIQSVAVSYTLCKELNGYGGFRGPNMVIRKSLTGKYTFAYRIISSYVSEWSTWLSYKEDMTADTMKEILDSYFLEWLTVPSKIETKLDRTKFK